MMTKTMMEVNSCMWKKTAYCKYGSQLNQTKSVETYSATHVPDAWRVKKGQRVAFEMSAELNTECLISRK
jgi:hypothetical protein